MKQILELIRKTSCILPVDVKNALVSCYNEESYSLSKQALKIILENCDLAEKKSQPICQDTGMPLFKVYANENINRSLIREQIKDAVREATELGYLRKNTVNSLTGHSEVDNIGIEIPQIYFIDIDNDSSKIKLLLKGGGCENKSIQYSLPCEIKGLGRADRDLQGVYKCIMHSIYSAQGQGCSPAFLGVAIGGDRGSSYQFAKEQLFREIDDKNPCKEIAILEEKILEDSKKLKIGTMGFGGDFSVLSCKIGHIHRIPASFFVSISYNCWALRRGEINL